MAIDKEYWKRYYNFWDEFVSDWLKSDANPTDPVTREYQRCVANLNFDELPEPYLGAPHRGVKAVFINLNPGGSCGDLETTKFYSNRNDERRGWLIRKYVDAQCSYRRFIYDWSALNDLREHKPEVCGFKWWQGRMKWVRQIYGDVRLCASNVFAPELCPYHSKGFRFNINRSKNLKNFFIKNLIVPTITATVENKLPFAIAIGAPIRKVIQNHLGLMPEKEWSCDMQRRLSDEMVSDIWPHSDNGRLSVRWYQLYRVCIEEKTARILVTWTRSASNPPPRCGKDGFFDVEQRIRQYVYANPIH